ncbi:MAG: NYN domain-containing protein [Vicinamibacteria bacterium]|nr:NYN domain-containing protein [Vicinamibacteria bacterium]
MLYLVDGNNLAHALGLSAGPIPDREACARAVVAFCRSQGARAVLVLDGPAEKGPTVAGQSHRVRVVFGEGRSADDLILRVLADSKTPRDFTVVTSDKSLGDRARHRGASLEKAHEFAKRLHRSSKPAATSGEKPAHRETPGQIEAWLAVFDPKRG